MHTVEARVPIFFRRKGLRRIAGFIRVLGELRYETVDVLLFPFKNPRYPLDAVDE